MSIIRQGSLFDLQDLYDLEPTRRFDAIFSAIDIEPILALVTKKSRVGRPVELNYAAMIYSLVARISERILFIKDLVKRLKNDMIFRLDCGFLVSDSVPSEAAFSRLITIISESNVMEDVQEMLLHQAIVEGFIMDNAAAIDASQFEARDQAPPKEEKPKTEPKKTGRKSKAEREQWLMEKAEKEAILPLYEKKIEEQLDVPLAELRSQIPQFPQWGVKKNSERKNVFWYGYKAHLAVGTTSQYIFQSLFSSGNLIISPNTKVPTLKFV